MYQFGIVSCFLMIKFRFYILLARTPYKWYGILFQTVILRWCWYISLSALLTYHTWLNWCLTGFSTINILFFLMYLEAFFWSDTLRYCKYLVSPHNFFPTNHPWWFLPVTIIMFAEWWLSSSFHIYSLEFYKEKLSFSPILFILSVIDIRALLWILL